MVREEQYYRNVAIWLEKNGYYVGRYKPNVYRKKELFIKRGEKKAQVDVAGVKNVGKSYFDEIEIAVIEVKHSNYPRAMTLRELEQTKSYQVYAHVCYLGVTEKIQITQENKNDANYRGIGLLKIPFDFYKKKPNQIRTGDIEVVVPPNKGKPQSESEMLEFLARLDILRCTICGCYFISSEVYEEEFPSLPPKGGAFKRLERNKVFELFPDKIEDQYDTRHRYWKSKIWRHICLLCAEDLAKLYKMHAPK
jgi:hypothetical protein